MITSRNQARKARRREATRVRKLEKRLAMAEADARSWKQLYDYMSLERDRARGIEPYPKADSIEGLSYWVGKSIFFSGR